MLVLIGVRYCVFENTSKIRQVFFEMTKWSNTFVPLVVMTNKSTLKNSEVKPAYGKIKFRKSRLRSVFELRLTKAEAKLLG